MIANKFVNKFTQPPILLTGNKSKRQHKRHFHQLTLTGTPSFTPVDTKEAIRLAKSSTVIGVDGMSTFQLKKLAHGAINYLTNILNFWGKTEKILTHWHPLPSCSTWLLADILDMHSTVDDHCRNCCRLLMKKASSPNSARRARSDCCIRLFGPSTTARLCLQHQHADHNPSLALQLYAEQTSQISFSEIRILMQEGEDRSGTR